MCKHRKKKNDIITSMLTIEELQSPETVNTIQFRDFYFENDNNAYNCSIMRLSKSLTDRFCDKASDFIFL